MENHIKKSRYKRISADKALALFRERIEKVNNDPYFLFKVKKVIIFGSYLGNAPIIGDVDIAVELEPRHKDKEEQSKYSDERIGEAIKGGKRFQNIWYRYNWPCLEVFKYLKARSRIISLHDMTEFDLMRKKKTIDKFELIYETK